MSFKELTYACHVRLGSRITVGCQIDNYFAVKGHGERLTEIDVAKWCLTRVQINVDQIVCRIPVTVVLRVGVYIRLVDISNKVGTPINFVVD